MITKIASRIASLVEDWSRMDAGQKRQVLETIFVDVTIEDGTMRVATPRAGRITYLEGVLAARTPGWVGRRRRESNPR